MRRNVARKPGRRYPPRGGTVNPPSGGEKFRRAADDTAVTRFYGRCIRLQEVFE